MDNLIYNDQVWVTDTNPRLLVEAVGRCILLSGLQRLEFAEHHFTPHGYTCFWLLSESHVAVHTFPERGVAYIEICCCNRDKKDKLVTFLLEELHVTTP